MGLIKCYECGAEISDKAIECPKCGAPQNEENIEEPKGSEIAQNVAFTSQIDQAEKDKENRAKAGSKRRIILMICVGCILILGIGYALRSQFITSINVYQENIYVSPGEEIALSYTLSPGFIKDDVLWSTDDPNIAVVRNGVVTGVGEGNVNITAKTSNGKTDSCKVTSASVYDQWEWEFAYLEGKRYDSSSFMCKFSIDEDRCTFSDYLGNTYTGTWKYEETHDGIPVYSFDAEGLYDFYLTATDTDLTVCPQNSADIIIFFRRK